jgi:outer membrane protein TolC
VSLKSDRNSKDLEKRHRDEYLFFSARFFIVFCILSLSTHLHAGDNNISPLPEPLSLEYALQLANEPHPDRVLSKADLEQAEAQYLGVKSEMGINASVVGRAQWVEPTRLAPDQSNNDSSLSFYVRKKIFDFGKTSLKLSAAETDIRANKLLYIDTLNRRRIEIMERFFDVLLADLEFIRDREAVAVAFYRFQRLQGQRELGQTSDLELLEAETKYMETRRKRSVSEMRQQYTRELLAEALNRPGILPVTLAEPELPSIDRELPEAEELIKKAFANDPTILALRAKVDAALENLKAVRAENNPILSAEFEASAYEREFGSRDRLRAGLILEIPIFTGGRTDSKIADHTAKLHRIESQLSLKERAIRQAVLEAWQQIKVLHLQLEEVRTLMKYSDLYLDRSRTIYEQGLKAYLGDALVRYSEARLRLAQTKYALALSWERLDALTGKVREVPDK